ncbi:MAG: hypothetical protein CL834_05025 [Crocinitomicaceae bacterium]|jgi:hypothetical protein|nr:hypothetical protein [Crocinitomicaceae bacterium]|tara:strand:+ start:69 stop:560 length:492 start_codon:yes stop_codon:yes gene_type:complete
MEHANLRCIDRKAFLSLIFVLAALLILFDFGFPGKVVNDEIVCVQRKVQQHHNAARGFHYSHRLVTTERAFSVSEELAQRIEEGTPIVYSVSRFFDEVNWCKTTESETKAYFSLRWLSALFLPLLAVATMTLSHRYRGERDMSILVFVFQVLLLVDLLFLVFK